MAEKEYFKLKCPCCQAVFYYRHQSAFAVASVGALERMDQIEALDTGQQLAVKDIDEKLVGYRYYITCPSQHKILFEYPDVVTCLDNL